MDELKRRLFDNVDIKRGTGPVRSGGAARRPPHPSMRRQTGLNLNRTFGVQRDRTAAQLLDTALDPVRGYSTVNAKGERVDKPAPQWVEGCASRMIRLEHGSQAKIETIAETDGNDATAGASDEETESFTADVAIVTNPFSALRHGLDDDERYAYALRGMQAMSGKRNRYVIGEAAVFAPCQFTELHPHIPSPVGRVHFAGEHTSLKHSWIEGSPESAVRAALEVNAS
ncbi:FAD-dependent oxidoreductase [Lentzea sp. NBRC 105346]|uniref:FAD-dependent oxidoreductase n=1 Tax=Lentzea sp. NBRC 105346 TaxID=3032205 RepID=UPI00255513FA|nr:FAD-dependent oxidoreductase [Lentzea sp. NBRC 105346]